jgi:hypothetical protein
LEIFLYKGGGFGLALNGDIYFGVYADGLYVIASTVEINKLDYSTFPIAVAVTIDNQIAYIKHGGIFFEEKCDLFKWCV